MELVYFNLFF